MHLGIDLGTTSCRIARVDAQGCRVLFPDLHEPQRFQTPAVVHIGADGALVGQAAEELLEDTPDLPVLRRIKAQLGSAEPLLTDPANRRWLPESVAALLLMKLLRDVKAHSDEPIESVVVCVPAHAAHPQRQATWDAALLADLPIMDLVEEPLAVAAHYGADTVERERKILVYDLGGGTFDATVLLAGRDGARIMAATGVPTLNGNRFNDVVVEALIGQLATEPARAATRDRALVAWHRHAETLKIQMTDADRPVICTAVLAGERVQEIVLTRSHFEKMTAPLIQQSITLCETTLRQAGLDWSGIDEVILSGASTLFPAVTTALGRASGKPPDRIRRQQPHLAVAYGAAVLAGRRAGMTSPSAPGWQPRGTAFDLGFRVVEPGTQRQGVDTIIPRNTPMPVRRTTMYYSNRADQRRMVFEVVQVKDRTEDAISLGHFVFALERPRRNHPLEVTLGYDERGLVTVVARNPDTGHEVQRGFAQGSATWDARLDDQRPLLAQTKLCE